MRWATTILWAAATASALAGAGRAVAADEPAAPAVTDPQVGEAIRRGLDFLWSRQKPDGSWDNRYASQHPGGAEALVVWTALEAGTSPDLAGVQSALKVVERSAPGTVYARALRTIVFARLGPTYADRLKEEVAWLQRQQDANGGWGYGPTHPTTQMRPRWTDSSNSQMAVLALYEAAEAGAPVSGNVWEKARLYWERSQNGDGGWGYEPPGGTGPRFRGSSYGSMTAAGAASALLILDRRLRAGGGTLEAPTDAAEKGLKWLADHYNLASIPGWSWGSGEESLHYYLHCLARAAQAAGRRTIGRQDWWPQVAAELLRAQNGDGGWADSRRKNESGEDVIRTCQALLTLLEGRRPVLLSKLALAGVWGPDCRDAAGLAHAYGRQEALPVAWQLVEADAPAEVLADTPVLYLSGSGKAEPPAALAGPLRQYLRAGGTVLVQPLRGNPEFAAAAQAFFQRTFPDWSAEKLPPDHPVYSGPRAIPPDQQPSAVGLSDCLRTRIFLLRADCSGAWHAGREAASPGAFAFFSNLVAYSLDGGRPGRRLRGPAGSAPVASRQVTVARLRHAGQWDVCPGAMDRLGEVLASAVSVGVKEAAPVDLSQDVPGEIAVLWMTGSTPPRLDNDQRRRLTSYLLRGGMLFLDPAAGQRPFFEAAYQLLCQMFPPSSVKVMPSDHPILQGTFAGGMGSDVRRVAFNRHAPPELRKGPTAPPLWIVEVEGRTIAVLSRYAVTCPLEGLPTFGCAGLETPDARRLAANVVLFAAFGRGK